MMTVPPRAVSWTRSLVALFMTWIVDGFVVSASASADDVEVSAPLCASATGSSGGQNADVELDTNSALSRADGGAAQENSSHAEVVVFLTLPVSLTATVQMGV